MRSGTNYEFKIWRAMYPSFGQPWPLPATFYQLTATDHPADPVLRERLASEQLALDRHVASAPRRKRSCAAHSLALTYLCHLCT